MIRTDCPTEAAGEPLTEVAAEAYIPRTCFKHGPPGRVGLELEFLLTDAQRPDLHVGDERHHALFAELSALPRSGRLTVEPGGQLELSSLPGDEISQVVKVVAQDLDLLARSAADHGIHFEGVGLDPRRPPRRLLAEPRYSAMEAYFDRGGPAGRVMMCCTASVQVNVEAGTGVHPPDGADMFRRWQVLHAIGPAVVAAFANSPLYRGRPTAWKSTRQAVWMSIDRRRTAMPAVRNGESVPEAWARYGLDAPLLLVRRPAGRWTAPRGVTFRDWLRAGRRAVPDLPPPTVEDLDYHLTTLFPPVRARGHLEVRYIDAQPGPWWQVPAAVVAGVLDDDRAADLAQDACTEITGRWRDAARYGLGDPAIRRAAVSVVEAACAALDAPGTAALARLVEQYHERWTARGRCPGDDLLSAAATGTGTRAVRQHAPAPPRLARVPHGRREGAWC